MDKSAFLLLSLALLASLLLAGCVQPDRIRVVEGKPAGEIEPTALQPQGVPQEVAEGGTTGQPVVEATPAAAPVAPAQAGEFVVSVTDDGFDPVSLSVAAGSRVKFTNNGRGLHDVVFIDRESEALAPGESFETTFPEAGSYGFSDSFNPQATATIEVS